MFDAEKEAKLLIPRLEKSNKVFIAGTATESWKMKKVFPLIKEKYPEAKVYTCARVIYLTVRKEQEEALLEHLQKRKIVYKEMLKNKQYTFGKDEEMVKETIKEIEETLGKVGRNYAEINV